MGVLCLGLFTAAACTSEEASTPPPASIQVVRGHGPQVLSAHADALSSTLAFLHERRAELGLPAPRTQLTAMHTSIDGLSMTHVRLQQVERGLRVTGGEVNAHYDRAGRLTSIQQRVVPSLETLDLTPAVDAARATALAIAAKPGHRLHGQPELVVCGDDAPALAWELTVTRGLTSAWQIDVDAKTGAILATGNMAHSITALEGSGIGLDGERHPVHFALDTDNSNVMADVTRDVSIVMWDANNTDTLSLIKSTEPTSWDATSPTAPGSAVTAAGLFGQINDFFRATWGRRGWDGVDGQEDVIVHIGNPDNTPMDNAMFIAALNHIVIGDGATVFKPLAGALDVLAHEFGHAVTGSTAKLAFGNQPGALNEHLSDVFGAVVEHGLRPDPVNNWLIGEGTLRSGDGPLRDMGAPEKGLDKQPRHMKEFVQTSSDDGGVHINNGIGNNAAFLATVGGTNAVSGITVKKGFGWENLAKVWYRADTVYLTSNADYAILAKATLAAAEDLNLSKDDIDTLDCAWKAVGVVQGECVGLQAQAQATTTDTTPAPTSDGEDASGSTSSTDDSDEATTPRNSEKNAGAAAATYGCAAGSGDPSTSTTWLAGCAGVVAVLRRRKRR